MSTDRIEKEIALRAPIDKVWRALSDHVEFGQWFGMQMHSAFVAGMPTKGTYVTKTQQRIDITFWIDEVRPKQRLTFYWHPFAIDPAYDYSKENKTLVELELEAIEGGTKLRVTESGFDALPLERREKSFIANGQGWGAQIEKIKRHVEK